MLKGLEQACPGGGHDDPGELERRLRIRERLGAEVQLQGQPLKGGFRMSTQSHGTSRVRATTTVPPSGSGSPERITPWRTLLLIGRAVIRRPFHTAGVPPTVKLARGAMPV